MRVGMNMSLGSISKVDETTFLSDVDDCFLNEANKTANTSANNSLTVNNTTNSKARSLIRFDCSALSGRQATSAFLVLYNNTSPGALRSFSAYKILSANSGWTDTANWNTKDGSNAWAGGANGLVSGTDYDATPIANWTVASGLAAGTAILISLPIDLVQQWIDDSNDNHGIMFTTSDSSSFVYRSSDHTTTSNHPALVVQHRQKVQTYVDPNLAFPGAEGYGRFSQGGKGGTVIHVTNLNNSGAGSLRYACVQTYPRIVVFDVAGTIELDTTISIYNPYITIAGQTAPGDGITLKLSSSNYDAPISFRTHDFIVACIRSMPGVGGTNIEGNPRYGDAVDSFGNWSQADITYNGYFYHCTGMWSVDEIIDLYKCRNITIDSCLLAEPLNLSTHSYTADDPQIGHAKFILASNDSSRNISILRTTMALGMDRFPESRLESGYLDLVNCVIYGWGTDQGNQGGRIWVTNIGDTYGNQNANIVKNYYKPGPDSANRSRIYYSHNTDDGSPVGNKLTAYVLGNTDTVLGALSITQQDAINSTLTLASEPVGEAAYTEFDSASDALVFCLDEMGAGCTWGLDEDGNKVARTGGPESRIKDHIQNGTGAIIDDPSDVGGWPVLDTGTAYTDTNGDGIPDAYTLAYPNATIQDFLWPT